MLANRVDSGFLFHKLSHLPPPLPAVALMEQCLDAEQLQWVENELDVPTSDEPVAAVDADPIGDDEENEDDE